MRLSERDEYERREEQRREERRRFEADAAYEVWRSGGDVDAVDHDRLHDAFHEGASSSEAAQAELARQRRAEQAYHHQAPEPDTARGEEDDQC